MQSVGACAFDHTGTPVAALSVPRRIARATTPAGEVADAVRQAARRLTRAMSGTAPAGWFRGAAPREAHGHVPGRIEQVIISPGPRGWTSSLHRVEGRPVLRWEGDRAWRSVSSGVLGGGMGTSRWVLNATVPTDFDDDDPAGYLARLAATVGLAPEAGIGLLTAVDVDAAVTVARPEVTMCVTTGVGPHAQWPAVRDARVSERCRAGTVNAVAWLDRPVTSDALVNGVITVTEAKTQAFLEAGVAGTGTCTDSVTLLCPILAGDDDGHGDSDEDGEPTRYLGSRSPVGQALATATHTAVATGLRQERAALAAST